jgi:hypothetical protein
MSMEATVAKLVPTKSDAEIAADLKRRAVELYGPLIALMDEAKELGFHVSVACGPGPLGNTQITNLQVARLY